MRLLLIPVVVIALCASMSMMQGCTVYKAAVDERNIGTIADDESITLTIKKDFLADDLIKYLDYDVASYEGRVYLMGEYESQAQVNRAISLAKKVDGVRSVTTYLLPKRENDTCGTTDNLELYARVNQKLIEDKEIWSTNVDVYTVQCNVVLVGIVGSATERNRAIAHARSVPGVRSVKSYLKVK
ncbi:BON domain-containing protein [Salidesulfovibrio onnuriiensis]|uniref:BON domain-containing protein n=1 Tax=Salidesulfovibrio onnuriiensis TaxID=2583823 RepID=UPI0011CA2088|nr:BON domain-containing protein [Salidesulfovibrio onnuriiensis]